MGYDLNRFIGPVDDLVICCICLNVLENPMQCSRCEHAFCRSCINSWLELRPVCPVSRHNLLSEHLVCVPRILRNILGRLRINCVFAGNGCQAQLALENLRAHEASCEKNPTVTLACNDGCGMLLPSGELQQHTCLSQLRGLVEQRREQIQQLQLQLAAQERTINNQSSELENVHNFILSYRLTCSVIDNIGVNWDRICFAEWTRSLPEAIVRDWDKLISAPDWNMLSNLKDSLRGQGCPMQVIDAMICNSHEANASEFLHGYQYRLLQPLSSGEHCVLILGPELRLGMIMFFEDGVERSVVDNGISGANGNPDG